MSLVIREFEFADYGASRALWEETPGVGLSEADEPAAIDQFLTRNPGLSFVAVEGRSLIGTILCGHDGRRGLIHHLVCTQDARRQGIGKALLAHGLNALNAVGIKKCHLMVFNSNEEGMAFWRAVKATKRTELALFSLNTKADA